MLAVAIIVIAVLAIVVVVVTTGRMTGRAGRLSRETRASDRSAVGESTVPGTDLEAVETSAAQARADEARARAAGGAPVPRAAGTVTEYQPIDPEELSVTRRQFFNRAILTVAGLAAIPTLGAAVLAFL